ncbi:MAG: 16S rRNA (cytosine(1402)-N(4))-methyltransferase RsmH [Gammaproteobacteria bacterium]
MRGHEPVLLAEVLEGLEVRNDGAYLDATYGRGGHSGAILGRLGPSGRLLAIDRDPEAVAAARQRFGEDARFSIALGSFGRMRAVAAEAGFERQFDGILLDLGVSSPQLDDPARGFSFLRDGPLDMRMNPDAGQSAADWLATASERDIAHVLRTLGEERFARRIARAILAARAETPIVRTVQLAEIVARAVPTREKGQHPATRSFQAIRLFINRELDELAAGLEQAVERLAPAGRLCVIAFHSLEDRIVKRYLRNQSRVPPEFAGLPEIPPAARPRLAKLRRPVRPSAAEIARNPRARSAILRVAERSA